jgi:hypothetical protein
MSDDLRTRIAAVLAEHQWYDGEPSGYCYCGEIPRDGMADHQADAVIRELNTERDELVNEAIRDLQEKYILVPKSQTLAEMAPPRLVIDRDCTPLEWPAEWKEGGQ